MYKVILRKSNRAQRKLRVRRSVFGTPQKPRLSVFRSLKHLYAQIIDDVNGVTLASIQTAEGKTTKSEKSFEAGKELAKKASEKGVTQVVFDRNGYQYQGRVKSLAEGAREGGLKF